jgi:predicted nucleotidyltransferase
MDPKDIRPADWPPLDVENMLRRLTTAGVDFVVIGAIALVLHGSARLTRDLDIAFASDDANLEALGGVLVGLNAQLREADEGLPFTPDAATLRNVQLLTLTTSSGWLDVHKSVDGAPPYEVLRRSAERVDLGGFFVLVASLDDLEAMKRAAGRAQDLADLVEIEELRRQRRRAKKRRDD